MNPGVHHASVHFRAFGETLDRHQIPFEVAAGNPQSWIQIGVRTDPLVQPQGRGDFRPIGTDGFADFSQ